MLTVCTEPGCGTLVLGGKCVDHELPQTHVFVRGRPFVSGATGTAASTLRLRGHALLEVAHDVADGAVLAVVGSRRKAGSLLR